MNLCTAAKKNPCGRGWRGAVLRSQASRPGEERSGRFRWWFQPVNATCCTHSLEGTMGRHYRRLTAGDRAVLWTRWQRGETLLAISEALGTFKSNVWSEVHRRGGLVPAPRHRAPRVLQSAEREEISRGLAAGESLRRIAHRVGRAPSTISREIRRHGGGEAISGERGGCGGVGARPAPQALSPGAGSAALPARRVRPAARLVAGADRAVAARELSRRARAIRLARDDLPHALRASARGAPAGAPRTSVRHGQR